MGGSEVDAEIVVFALESRVAAGLPAAAALRIERAARRFNALLGLTGELRLQGGTFRLLVEGPGWAVQPLAGRILADPRHHAIRILAFGRRPARGFERWTSAGFEPDGLPASGLRFVAGAPRQPVIAIAGAGGR